MKISAIITTAALGLTVLATPAIAESAVNQADKVQAGNVNNFSAQFRSGGEFFVPPHIQRELAERDSRD
ncbi:MAG: hypothetical protein AAFY73_00515 [Pseudomonadota bacterium]